MGDTSITVTPTIGRYELRTRTPTTPKNATPTGRSLRSQRAGTPNIDTPKEKSTPLRSCNTPNNTPLRACNTPVNTPSRACNTPVNTPSRACNTPVNTPSRACNTPTVPGTASAPTPTPGGRLRSCNTPTLQSTPVTPSSGRLLRSNSTPKTDEKLSFKTPMSFKPRLVGNKPVPSPSRAEIWKEELGLADDPSCNSDKENTSSDDEDGQLCETSLVEYRALQKVLAEKNAQRDETLLQMKNYKDKIRLLKSRLEREESTKRQQLKILRKSHEAQLHEKTALIDRLQALVTEQEERLKEIEENTVTTPRKRKQLASSPTESASKLIEDVKRLQLEKTSLASQLNEVQYELNRLREETEPLKGSHIAPTSDKGPFTNGDSNWTSLENNDCNHSIVPASCTTDTEKQVEVLQAENERLVADLTETRNAHTKALTVSKLNNHRHQQLEDEIGRLKQKVCGLEGEVERGRAQLAEQAGLQEAVSRLELDNMRLQGKVKEAQAEYFSAQAKSPEVVKETRVKEVESEALRKRYEEKKAEIEQLKQALGAKKDELHNAHTHVKYLEKMVQLAQTEKEVADSQLWKELESLNTEHRQLEHGLRQQLHHDKQLALQQLENQLQSTHKTEIDEHQRTLEEQYNSDVAKLKENEVALRTAHQCELQDLHTANSEHIAKLKEETAQQVEQLEELKNKELAEMERENTKMIADLEQSLVALKNKHKVDIRNLEEDLTIAKTAAVTKVREELQKDKEMCLQAVEEKLQGEHAESIAQLKEQMTEDLEMAVIAERQRCQELMADLQSRYEALVQRLAQLNPVLSGFVEAYILLQREVEKFPRIIEKTVTNVKKEVLAAIAGVSEHNKELTSKYQREMKLRKKYHNELVELKGNIRVFCRVRPIIKEDGAGQQAEEVVAFDKEDDGILLVNCKTRPQTFEVDRVFDGSSTQETVYNEVKALVTSCIDGFNVCIFAYGQTGSGKTYTMEGVKSDPGINQRALCQLFEDTTARGDWQYTVTVSVLEIYNEMIRDLLSDDTSYKMEVKINPDGGFHIPGLSYYTVTSVNDVNECFTIGQSNRATAATNMNEHSSRSHALLCVTVVGVNKLTGVKTTGKLNLVDLAGSERVSKSKSDGTRLKEAQSINKSLSSLGDVIYALRSKQSFIPYRNSKLTYLLQDSLGGDSKTLMITQISPVRKNEGETICSLNFAQRVRNVELGAATRKLENGDVAEFGELRCLLATLVHDPLIMDYATAKAEIQSLPCSPARTAGTPQRGIVGLKPGTPLSNSKLTPVSRQNKKR